MSILRSSHFSLPLLGLIVFVGSDVHAAEIGHDVRAVLKANCVDCHAGKEAEAGLDLETLSADLSNKDIARKWTSVFDKVSSGEMPPRDEDPLKRRTKNQFLQQLSTQLTVAHKKRNDVVLRRLNRAEYENTIRDLFGVDVQLKGMLPEETLSNGFDNVGEALSTSAELIDIYLKAADIALDKTFGPEKKPKQIKLSFNLKDAPKMQRLKGKLWKETKDGLVVFGKSGQQVAQFWELQRTRKEAGTYRVQVKVKTFQSKQPIAMHVYAGDVIANIRPKYIVGYYDIPVNKQVVIQFEAYLGKRDNILLSPYGKELATSRRDANVFPGPGLHIGDIELEGPLEEWPPASAKNLLGDVNVKFASGNDARKILIRFIPKAFRRKMKPNEVAPYMKLVKQALAEKRPFKEALRLGLKAILCSPEFLFLEEPGRNKISDEALASRLSYFLWSSMPDEELFSLAANGKLNSPQVLRQQVERMLKDPKAKAFTDNFTGQWLKLRDIDFTEPDKKLYPEFDEPLKEAMVKETHLFFQEILDKNLSLMNFIDSDFVIINQRLARHYGIPNIKGQQFRKVTLPKVSPRGGVLTQASVLKVTANGTNTSPVVRGIWVMENIMGITSPPPPDVPAVEPDTRGATTLREQLAKHRNVESCAVCHVKIDPPGFALENFNVIGGWRDNYRSMGKGKRLDIYIDKFAHVRVAYKTGPPVDATGTTPDGKPFKDIIGFKKLLSQDKQQITKGLTEKLLIYSIGRGLGFSDRPAIATIVEQTQKQNHQFRTLIHTIVQSELFRKP